MGDTKEVPAQKAKWECHLEHLRPALVGKRELAGKLRSHRRQPGEMERCRGSRPFIASTFLGPEPGGGLGTAISQLGPQLGRCAEHRMKETQVSWAVLHLSVPRHGNNELLRVTATASPLPSKSHANLFCQFQPREEIQGTIAPSLTKLAQDSLAQLAIEDSP